MRFVTFSAGSLILSKVSKNLAKSAENSHAFEKVTNWNLEKLTQVAPHESKLIKQEFISSNIGFGWWAWKALIIDIEMQNALEDDLILYMDAGNTFKKYESLKKFVTSLEASKKNFDLVVTTVSGAGVRQFGSEEFKWTKPSVLKLLKNMDEQKTSQYAASWILIKKNKKTSTLIKNWRELSFSNDFKNINENYEGVDASENFITHRHDQSLLSISVKNSLLLLNTEKKVMAKMQSILNDNIEIGRNRNPIPFNHSMAKNIKIKKIFHYLYVLENKIKKHKNVRKFIILVYRLRKNS
jgi:hypothetical protein